MQLQSEILKKKKTRSILSLHRPIRLSQWKNDKYNERLTKNLKDQNCEKTGYTCKNGWKNMLILIAILSMMKHMISNFVTNGLITKLYAFKSIASNFFEILLFLLIIVLRSIVIYHFTFFRKLCFFIILLFEFITSTFVYHKIEYVHIKAWAHIFSLVLTMKHVSFTINFKQISLKKYLDFLLLPTLVYQEEYKRKKYISWKIVFTKTLLFIFHFFAFIFVIDQYMIPSIYHIFHSEKIYEIIDYYITFAIANIVLFKLFFELVFRNFIQIVSELMKYDECCYSEWWNSMSLKEFWTKWNRPVTYFIKIHIFKSLIYKNFSPYKSSSICFLISGIAHEIVIALAFKKLSGLFFFGMVAQIPLIYISEIVKRRFPRFANIFFWIGFCAIGQPMLLLLFYRSIKIREF